MSIVSIPIRFFLFSLFAFLVCRGYLYFTYADYFSSLTLEQIVIALIKGAQFDSATIASSGAIFFLLLCLPFRFFQKPLSRRISLYLLSAWLFILVGYCLVDVSYFGEVKRHIGAEILNIGSDIGAITAIAFSSRLSHTLIGLVIIALLGLIGYFFVLRAEERVSRRPQLSFGARLLSCLGVIVFMVIAIRGFIFQGRPINLSDAFTQQGSLEQANLILNPVYLSFRESKNRLQQKPLELVPEQDLQAFVQANPDVFDWQNAHAQASGKNIVFILLESWTSRYIDSLSGSAYKVTPFFDQLIQKSQVWDHYYAAGQRSIIGIQAALTSVPVLPSQATIGFGLELKNFSRIADIAKQNNYQTLMMQTSKRRSFQMENIAKALGFEHYYGQEDIPLLLNYPQEQPHFGWDYEGLQFLASQLSTLSEAGKRPFFAFIFTGTTHEPFAHLPSQFETYPHDSRSESGYLNTLYYSDWSLQEFFKRVEKEPWFKNTIFILSADHTLNTKIEPPVVDDSAKASREEAISAEDFHIPLLIYAPDGSLKPERHHNLASQYDLFPSMMDLLGFKQDIKTFGQSLFSPESLNNHHREIYLLQGDVLGMLNTQHEAVFFNEQGIQQIEPGQNVQQDLERLKLKLQYADELLRHNQWLK